nr:restriction endonuclease subunit S [uncultured Methanobrevibacter sp.]
MFYNKKLRFVDESWDTQKLGNICKITMGQSPSSSNYSENKEDTVLIQGNADLINGEVVPRVYTSEITKTSKPGDIILTVRAPVGDLAINEFNSCIGRGVCSIEGDKFIYYFLQSLKDKHVWERLSQGSTFESINSNDIKNLKIKMPSEKTQKSISNFLTSIDIKIRLLEKKYDYYQDFKKFLMQQIFAQKLRFGFDDEWKEIKLNEVLKERKNYAKINEYPHVTLSKEGIHPKTERYNRNFLVKDDNKKYKITHFGDICYNPANLKFGVITMNKFGTAIFSPIYITFEVNNINKEFLAYYLIRNDFINKVRRFEEGTVYERMAVKPSDFLNERIFIPTLQEQEKIADLLLNVDLKIEAIKNQLTDVIKFKKGLLQQMFDNMPLLFKFNIIINK